MKDISIIVPIYNTYEYLEKCISSIINQKNHNLKYEIILVNDGSPDNSYKICEKFQKEYKKIIKYIYKENGGVSSARNEGLNHANSKYLLFIDSDDYLEDNLFHEFEKNNDNFDLFVYNFNKVFNTHSKIYIPFIYGKMNYDNFLHLLFEDDSVRGYTWNKFYKKEIVIKNNLLFDEKINYIEDLLFSFDYLQCIKLKKENIFVSKKRMYNYIQRDNSLINSSFNKNKLSAIKVYEKIYDLIKKDKKSYSQTIKYFMFELQYELSVRIKINKNNNEFISSYFELKKGMKNEFWNLLFSNIKLKYKRNVFIKLVFFNVLVLYHRIKNEKN